MDHQWRHLLLVVVLVLGTATRCRASGNLASIAISYGGDPVACAIEASKEQGVLCWSSNSTLTGEQVSIPPLLGISGGGGFFCGLRASDRTAFCFPSNLTAAYSNQTGNGESINTVPPPFRSIGYASIAAGESHVCALRFSSPSSSSSIDCWGAQFDDSSGDDQGFLSSIVAGSGFTCGLSRSGRVSCWGDDRFGIVSAAPVKTPLESISAGRDHACGVQASSRTAICWGRSDSGQLDAPRWTAFAMLAVGSDHSCGIRRDSHEIVCWGSASSQVPRPGAEFLSLASADAISCGIRESNLLADCWTMAAPSGGGGDTAAPLTPPLELFSPGVCSSAPCPSGAFAFNASSHEMNGQICAAAGQRICSPCATSCPSGAFLASPCTAAEDRACVDCAACSTPECKQWCLDHSTPARKEKPLRSVIIAAAAGTGSLLAVAALLLLLSNKLRTIVRRPRPNSTTQHGHGRQVAAAGAGDNSVKKGTSDQVQIFRFAELRDATCGFREANEMGRGSYGIVYRAALPDGTLLAVKRASAARRIECSSKEFEAELEALSRARHEALLVNLVGFCDQVGERLLAFELMPRGSLAEHLHWGEEEEAGRASCSCSMAAWGTRISVAVQAAKGLVYLHQAKVYHGRVRSSNILFDRDWKARLSDFGLWSPKSESRPPAAKSDGQVLNGVPPPRSNGQQATRSSEADVYGFGVVLLELVTGRRADDEQAAALLVEWAAPLVKRRVLDPFVDQRCGQGSSVKQNMSRMAEMATMCLDPKPKRRPSMVEIAAWLDDLSCSFAQHQHQQQHHHQQNIACINLRDRMHF